MLKGKMVNLKKILPILLILVILVLPPYFLSNYYLGILDTVLAFVAISISWQFFSALTKYISLGSVAFVGTGLYFTSRYLNISMVDKNTIGLYPVLPLPVVVFLFGGLVNFVVALAIGSITLRIKGIYFAIATFGIGELIRGIIKIFETQAKTYEIPIGALFDRQIIYYSVLITTLAILLLTTFLRRSKFGLALRMIGENEEAAVHVGVNTSLIKILGFAISAMCMGLIGGSYAITFPSTNVDNAFAFNYSFLPAVMVMLGGVGTVYGSIIGASFLSLLQQYVTQSFSYYWKIILGVTLMFIVLFMPNGIMGVVQTVKARLMGRRELAKAPKMPP